jgi:hypothetical protein
MAKRKAFPLRINEALYAELRSWADAEFRSVNAQIEFLLRQAVRERKRAGHRSDPGEGGEDPPEESA